MVTQVCPSVRAQMRQSGPKNVRQRTMANKDGQGYATKVVGGVVQKVPIAVRGWLSNETSHCFIDLEIKNLVT